MDEFCTAYNQATALANEAFQRMGRSVAIGRELRSLWKMQCQAVEVRGQVGCEGER